MSSPHEAWPELAYEQWAPTKKTLQMCTQMLGKTRLALAPPQPEWMNASLQLAPRGFTTGAMPAGTRVLQASVDIFESAIVLESSDGRESSITTAPSRCVAEVWAEYVAALRGLGVDVDMWEKPQEVTDTTPFSMNQHDCTIVADHAQRFHRIMCSVNEVFEEFRARFFGRTGIQFWWGAFDYTLLLFNGKHAEAPDDRGYIMRYDLDAEHMNAGFWPGDDAAPAASFYGYIVPQPPGCADVPVAPDCAGWVESLGEWTMSYDAVRARPNPRQAVLDFLESVYAVATTNGGWTAEAHRYAQPRPARRM